MADRIVDEHRPVTDRGDVAAAFIERGKQFVERDVAGVAATPPAALIGRVRDDPVDPRAEGGVSSKRIDLPDHGYEGVLHGFLGILRVPRDPRSETAGAVAVGGNQILGSRRFTAAKGRHERVILVDAYRHARVFELFRPHSSAIAQSKGWANAKRLFLTTVSV